jgi:hypothetical protein
MENNQWKTLATGLSEDFQINVYEGKHVNVYKASIWNTRTGPDKNNIVLYEEDILELIYTVSKKVATLTRNPIFEVTWIYK